MLILTRRIGESLQIGNEIKVTVMSVAGNQVKIGIDAPHEVPVHRQEVYERIQRERANNTEQELAAPVAKQVSK